MRRVLLSARVNIDVLSKQAIRKHYRAICLMYKLGRSLGNMSSLSVVSSYQKSGHIIERQGMPFKNNSKSTLCADTSYNIRVRLKQALQVISLKLSNYFM